MTDDSDVLARHVLCILGRWQDFSIVRQVLDASYPDFTLDVEFSILSADDRMVRAFEVSAQVGCSTLTSDDLDDIGVHSAVAYVLSPPLLPELSESVSARALQLTGTLLRHGALAAKSESAGLAHGKETWLELAQKHQTSTESGDLHSARAALYHAWVQRPIVDDSIQYSVGMHLLGLPDTEVEAALDYASACEWIDLMGLYLVADKPSRPLLPGEGFRLSEHGPRRLIEKHACKRYASDDFFHTPFGYHRLVQP